MPSYTKRAIVESFLRLASKKSIARITVKDIVDDCRINRNTFYYYFKDIYNVAEEIFLFESVTDPPEKEGDTQKEPAVWPEAFGRAVLFVLEHRAAISNIYAAVGHEGIERYLTPAVGQAIDAMIRAEAGAEHAHEEDIALLSRFYQKAVIGLFTGWIAKGMREDPRRMAWRLLTLLRNSVKEALRTSAELPPYKEGV